MFGVQSLDAAHLMNSKAHNVSATVLLTARKCQRSCRHMGGVRAKFLTLGSLERLVLLQRTFHQNSMSMADSLGNI